MGSFRWCLLNLQIWTAMTDWMIAVLSVPRFSLPLMAGKALGVLGKLGISIPVQIYLGFGCFGGEINSEISEPSIFPAMVASTAVLFIYRQQVVAGPDHVFRLRKRNLVLLVAFNYLLYSNMSISALLSAPTDQLEVKLEILRVGFLSPYQ